MGRELTRGRIGEHATGRSGLLRKSWCAGLGSLAGLSALAGLEGLAGLESLVGPRTLAGLSDPAKSEVDCGVMLALLFLKRIRLPLPAWGSSPRQRINGLWRCPSIDTNGSE